MAKLSQATLTVLASIAITALVVVFVLPAHARGEVADQVESSDLRHAILVGEIARPSGDTPAGPTCPAFVEPGSYTSCPFTAGSISGVSRVPRGFLEVYGTASSGCPYLSALHARSGCPEMASPAQASACPFLSGTDRPRAGERAAGDDELPLGLTL